VVSNPAAAPRHDAVDGGLHQDLRLAAAAHAAHLHRLLGLATLHHVILYSQTPVDDSQHPMVCITRGNPRRKYCMVENVTNMTPPPGVSANLPSAPRAAPRARPRRRCPSAWGPSARARAGASEAGSLEHFIHVLIVLRGGGKNKKQNNGGARVRGLCGGVVGSAGGRDGCDRVRLARGVMKRDECPRLWTEATTKNTPKSVEVGAKKINSVSRFEEATPALPAHFSPTPHRSRRVRETRGRTPPSP